MKFRILLLSSIIMLASFKVTGQANLALSSTINIASNSFAKGDYLTFSFSVRNTGNVTAPKSHTSIYLSQTTTSSGGTLLSELSCEAIAANQQSSTINYVFPVPYNILTGANYIIFKIDSRNEVVESNENNEFYLTKPINITSNIVNNQNLPYPLIFIHGLNSDNKTWDNALIDLQNYFGWSFGGNLNYCLNQSEISTYKYEDYKPKWSDTLSLSAADFYTINFNIDRNGSLYPNAINSVLSNQSAIVKQGLAVKDAIKYVLKKTGRDKVILVGHSMGGLASREYLQNASLWQSDNKHHVAKLLTIGTPHGGSNVTGTALSVLVSSIGVAPDEKSEAVRDLRTDYTYPLLSYNPGVYLFGGTENYSSMEDQLLSNFYNVDVNCNGIDADGSMIIGLNNKALPSDLPYSCIIGTGNVLGGDGIVGSKQADINNYISTAQADTFICRQPFGNLAVWHLALPKQTEFIIKGLDESNEYNTAYGIDTGRIYFANFSVQSQAGYPYDFDDYKVSLSQNGLLNCKLYNIPTAKCYFNLLDSAQTIVYKDSTNGQGYYEFNKALNKGKYFIEFYTIPEAVSWNYPYAFKASITPTLPLTLLDFAATLIESKVLLKWITTNEINTNKFDIERSINGLDWNALGSKDATALVGINNYDFIDANPNYGTNYYRLKMIDKDGSYTYSQIRTVEVSKPNTPFVIAPNPAKSSTTIYFNSPISKAEISVYDALGRRVFINNYSGISTNKFELNTNNLLNGLYIVTVKTGDKNYNERLMISK